MSGAAGGSGYFLANTPGALERRLRALGDLGYTIQHYVVGVTLYVHYFQSAKHDRLEILSMDRRYETNVDAIGRLPMAHMRELTSTWVSADVATRTWQGRSSWYLRAPSNSSRSSSASATS